MRNFSFFAGSGFLDLGFEQAGFEIVFVNEYNPEFLRAYRYARERMQKQLSPPRFGYHQGDINDFLTVDSMRQRMKETIQICREEGELVGFIGGPLCPDFSIAGLQKLGGKAHGFNRGSMSKRGREGNLGRLSQSYVDLIISMHPDFFLFENVKGL